MEYMGDCSRFSGDLIVFHKVNNHDEEFVKQVKSKIQQVYNLFYKGMCLHPNQHYFKNRPLSSHSNIKNILSCLKVKKKIL